MTILGKPVLEIKPEFSSPPQILGQRGTEMGAVSQARRRAQFSGKHAVHTLNHQFVFTSRAAIRDFSDFFESVAGKWGGFWVPSWHAELDPLAIDGTRQLLSITPVDYDAVYLPDGAVTQLGNFVYLFRTNGAFHTSQVSSVATASPEVLTLASTIPAGFSVGNFFVGFLYYVRMINDKLSLEFNGPNEASTRIGMIETVFVPTSSDAKSDTDAGYADAVPATPDTPGAYTDPFGNPFTEGDGTILTY